jgi:hypothetical protein
LGGDHRRRGADHHFQRIVVADLPHPHASARALNLAVATGLSDAPLHEGSTGTEFGRDFCYCHTTSDTSDECFARNLKASSEPSRFLLLLDVVTAQREAGSRQYNNHRWLVTTYDMGNLVENIALLAC